MKNIFTDKNLLKREYIRLFLNELSHINTLCNCIEGRYGKSIPQETLLSFFQNDNKALIEFIGSSNSYRLEHFFGDFQNPDVRDKQISLLDRFILDSINFEVIHNLMVKFNSEYFPNQIDIDNAWVAEIVEEQKLNKVDPIYIIPRVFRDNKTAYFDELNFSSNSSVQLFTLKDEVITLNPQIFANWFQEQTNTSESTIINQVLQFLNRPLLSILILGAAGAGMGALLGVVGGVIGIVLGAVMGAIIGLSMGLVNKLNELLTSEESSEKPTDQSLNECSCCFSYQRMNERMPAFVNSTTMFENSIPLVDKKISEPQSLSNLNEEVGFSSVIDNQSFNA